jgi:hypothetical protein
MDYKKLDAALARELEQPGSLTVFIHAAAPLQPDQAAELASVGVSSRPGDRILTASLSAEAVAKLSEFPWIEQISLSQKRRPL